MNIDNIDETEVLFSEKDFEFYNKLRTRAGCSMFADMGAFQMNNNQTLNVGDFNLSRYIRHGFHQI